MKKIIELAEKATGDNKDALSAYSSYLELKNALAEYKRLSETPITEDWLKEHGFIDEPQERILIYRKDVFSIECDLTTWEWYWANGDVILHNLADLYDVLELCGITVED